jgi:hypothetical protein
VGSTPRKECIAASKEFCIKKNWEYEYNHEFDVIVLLSKYSIYLSKNELSYYYFFYI